MMNPDQQNELPRIGRPPLDDREKVAESQIQLRVTRKRKSAYVRAAQKSKLKKKTLAAWMFNVCDKASGYEDDSA